MMENIGYNEDYDQKGLELLKELISKEKKRKEIEHLGLSFFLK